MKTQIKTGEKSGKSKSPSPDEEGDSMEEEEDDEDDDGEEEESSDDEDGSEDGEEEEESDEDDEGEEDDKVFIFKECTLTFMNSVYTYLFYSCLYHRFFLFSSKATL